MLMFRKERAPLRGRGRSPGHPAAVSTHPTPPPPPPGTPGQRRALPDAGGGDQAGPLHLHMLSSPRCPAPSLLTPTSHQQWPGARQALLRSCVRPPGARNGYARTLPRFSARSEQSSARLRILSCPPPLLLGGPGPTPPPPTGSSVRPGVQPGGQDRALEGTDV